MTRPNTSPELYVKLLNCQATSFTVERILCKLLANGRHFSPNNVWKYLALYVNKSFEYITVGNTFAAGLIQAVCAKTPGSHVALRAQLRRRKR